MFYICTTPEGVGETTPDPAIVDKLHLDEFRVLEDRIIVRQWRQTKL
jgi:hypothetical protein